MNPWIEIGAAIGLVTTIASMKAEVGSYESFSRMVTLEFYATILVALLGLVAENHAVTIAAVSAGGGAIVGSLLAVAVSPLWQN